VPNLLGALVICAWVAMYFMHYEISDSFTNVILIIVGFIWGSSAGSKAKDTKPTEPPAGGQP
jgi:hypothetical protein